MNRDATKLLGAILATIVAVYVFPRFGLPNIILQALFLLFIIIIFRAKDDMFWLVWFYVVNDAPGRLFIGSGGLGQYSLPVYAFIPGVSIAFQEFFVVMYLIKSARHRAQWPFVFSRQVGLYIALGFFYFMISLAMGMSLANIIAAIRTLLPWFWLLIIPRYLKTPEDLKRVFSLLVPILVITFITLIQSYLTGNYLHNILGGAGQERFLTASEEHLARVSSAETILYFVIVISIYYMAAKRSEFNANLLAAIAFLGTFTVFISGTRGWLIAMLIVNASFFFIPGFGFFRQISRMVVIVGILVWALFSLFPILSIQSGLAIDRYFTLGLLLEGDLTAGGTLGRLTDTGPRVMEMFRESPVIGWAFSSNFWRYANMHVGNQTNLLNLGIMGFALINGVYLFFMLKIARHGRSHAYKEINGNAYIVFILGLVAMFAIHSSSGIMWGYLASGGTMPATAVFWGFYLAAVNAELISKRQSLLAHV